MLTCPACQAALGDPAARFCSRCGEACHGAAPAGATAKDRWYHNIWFVLVMLFFVLGPFGLPLVWSHPRLSRWVKTLLTISMVLYTVGLIKVTAQAIQAITRAVEQFNSTLSP